MSLIFLFIAWFILRFERLAERVFTRTTLYGGNSNGIQAPPQPTKKTAGQRRAQRRYQQVYSEEAVAAVHRQRETNTKRSENCLKATLTTTVEGGVQSLGICALVDTGNSLPAGALINLETMIRLGLDVNDLDQSNKFSALSAGGKRDLEMIGQVRPNTMFIKLGGGRIGWKSPPTSQQHTHAIAT